MFRFVVALLSIGIAAAKIPTEILETEGGAGVVAGPIGFGGIYEFSIPLEAIGIELDKLEGIESSCRCLEILSYPTTSSPVLRGRYLGVSAGKMDQGLTLLASDGGDAKSVEFFGIVGQPDGGGRSIDTWHELEPAVFFRHSATTAGKVVINRDRAQQLIGGGGVAIIDLRRPEDYFTAHIKGAINLAPHEVASKTFLRKRRATIITGDPFITPQVRRVIDQVRARGVRECYFLKGGVRQWQQGGGRIEGDRKDAIADAPELTAEELHRAALGEHLTILKLGGEIGFDEHYLFPGAQLFSCGEGESPPAELIEHLDSHPDTTLVVIPSQQSSAEASARLVASLESNEAWVLRGGGEAYRSFLADLSNELRSSRERETRVSSVGGVYYHSSGCSACPKRSR